MKKLLNRVTQIAAGTATALVPALAHAQVKVPEITQAGAADFLTILIKVANFLLGLAGAIAIVYLIWAGIQYIIGGTKGAGAAKEAVVNAIIGIVIIVLSYVIINTVVGLLA